MTLRYAWEQFRAPLQLDITAVRCNGTAVDVVEVSQRRVRLDKAPAWTAAELDVRLRTEESPPSPLTPERLRAHCLLSSPATQSRLPFPLAVTDDGAWEATLYVERGEVAGALELAATVTAADPSGRPLARGFGQPWSVIVDAGAAPVPPTHAPVRSEWIDFADLGAPPLCRQFPNAPYAVVMQVAEPVLYLNSTCKGFQKLLMAEHAQLERRRLRDVYATQIAATLTRTLLQAAYDELLVSSSGQTEAVPPDEPLLRQACEGVASVMSSVADVGGLYARMHDASNAGSAAVRALWAEMELAVMELTAASSTIVDVAEELR